jgi:hypothetical protein
LTLANSSIIEFSVQPQSRQLRASAKEKAPEADFRLGAH